MVLHRVLSASAFSIALLALTSGSAFAGPRGASEAPSGFDGTSNGFSSPDDHAANREAFEEVDDAEEGIGPIYNAASCAACHANPITGGASQITELRVGHEGPDGTFRNPSIPIGRGSEVISDRSLVNDRAICPSGDFPAEEVQERVPDSETIRAFRLSLNLLGDGFVEAIADQTLLDLARRQCDDGKGKICGQAILVPILEMPGAMGVGRFGWKDQHASLLSFSADAYLNEMGITTVLLPEDVTSLCDGFVESEENSVEDVDGQVFQFAAFMRATQAPARDMRLARSDAARHGSDVFDQIDCSTCHVRTLQTAPVGTALQGGAFVVPQALGDKLIHPFSDFLLHDVGTGDGISMVPDEHFGKKKRSKRKDPSPQDTDSTRFKVRTPPLWGVRLRPRLMHDAESLTFADAIARHGAEAKRSAKQFGKLSSDDQAALLAFLQSL